MERFNSRLELVEERISELENRSIEVIKSKEQEKEEIENEQSLKRSLE